MAINRYDKGDKVRVSGVFTNAAGSAVDPDVVRFKYRAPGASTVTLVYGTDAALVKDSTGNYHADVDCAASGVLRYRWESTGSGQAAAEGEFVIERSAFA